MQNPIQARLWPNNECKRTFHNVFGVMLLLDKKRSLEAAQHLVSLDLLPGCCTWFFTQWSLPPHRKHWITPRLFSIIESHGLWEFNKLITNVSSKSTTTPPCNQQDSAILHLEGVSEAQIYLTIPPINLSNINQSKFLPIASSQTRLMTLHSLHFHDIPFLEGIFNREILINFQL